MWIPVLLNTLELRCRDHCGRAGWKDCKNLRNRDFAVRLSPRNVKSYMHKISPSWLSKHEDNNEQHSDNGLANVDRLGGGVGGSPGGLSSIQRTTGNKGMLRVGELVLPMERQTNWPTGY